MAREDLRRSRPPRPPFFGRPERCAGRRPGRAPAERQRCAVAASTANACRLAPATRSVLASDR